MSADSRRGTTPGSTDSGSTGLGATGPGSPDAAADPQSSRWYDAEAGPVVRPYAMTRGRTSSASRHRLDLIALVVPEPAAEDPGRDQTLAPEHVTIVELCSDMPQSIAELAAELDLPVGVVRVLVGDLVEDELVHVTRPVPPAELPDVNILREVINGLRAL
ncbi:DUF742 domain-containing protein [Streptomyces sp. ISL-111]|uniref:DUF742 domain-containing protein n=1 Tax=unclassified Streptomyces TaxID=2593676 RepID=UPI001BE73CE1|nr:MULTISPECIES: DUF742 domain-containing protein [unclassified Streptomyces]MBT2380193.1 DUF742 domain-containing protein [Streptomyces sp. ISL-111]MBT2430152.1 DUF742 domain-containing protein [Streptomyces sp. ISL-112]MBT2465882.1 DUF742 domain-containing protein [Streptomyces sp. ISL-63]